jgi:AbrB family looped-hinge helix DNA binding protein
MSTARLTTKGQLTVPKEIRERLDLKPGDRVEFVVLPDGTVRFLPLNLPISALKGMLGKPPRRLSPKQLDEAVRDAWGTRWRRFSRRRGEPR